MVRVICLRRCVICSCLFLFFFSSSFRLLFCLSHKIIISPLFFSLKKKNKNTQNTQNFEKDDTTHTQREERERENRSRHLSSSHARDVIHIIHYYEFHAKRAINTSVGSVRTEPATSSRDFNHKGSFLKRERKRETRIIETFF